MEEPFALRGPVELWFLYMRFQRFDKSALQRDRLVTFYPACFIHSGAWQLVTSAHPTDGKLVCVDQARVGVNSLRSLVPGLSLPARCRQPG